MSTPPRVGPRSAALRAMFGGWLARREGSPVTACPYRAGADGAEGFLAWHWLSGWERGPRLDDPATLVPAALVVRDEITRSGGVMVSGVLDEQPPRLVALAPGDGHLVTAVVIAVLRSLAGPVPAFPVAIEAISGVENAELVSPVAFVLVDADRLNAQVAAVLPWGAVVRMARDRRRRFLAHAVSAADVARFDVAPSWLPQSLLNELARPWPAALAGDWI